MVFGIQVPGACCESRLQAVRAAHYDCFKVLPSNCSEDPQFHFVFRPMRTRMWRPVYCFDFSKPLFADRPDVAQSFGLYCIEQCDATNLKYTIDVVIEAHRPRCRAVPHMDLGHLVYEAARVGSLECLRLLFKEYEVQWDPRWLTHPCHNNRLDVLEILLSHKKPHDDWCPRLASVAAVAGHFRVLERIFRADCPVWEQARDHGPYNTLYMDEGHVYNPEIGRCLPMEDWTLVVPPDPARSVPVLLYALQKGVPLTPRMLEAVGEARRRAQAFAECFYKAQKLSQQPGVGALRYKSMAGVPVEIMGRIATLAKISIYDKDFLE